MQIQFQLDDSVLNECGLSKQQLSSAIQTALQKLVHPVTGHPIYLNYEPVVEVLSESTTSKSRRAVKAA